MNEMFRNATAFSQPLSRWTGPAATTTSSSVFTSALAFLEKYSCSDQNDGPVSSCTCSNFEYCLNDFTFHDAISACLLEDPIHGACLTYGSVSTKLGASISIWDTSRVTDMAGAFKNRIAFKGDISGWDTRAVTNMEYLLFNATSFTADLSQWSGVATQGKTGRLKCFTEQYLLLENSSVKTRYLDP